MFLLRDAQLVRPGDMEFGGLLLKSQTPGYYVQAPLTSTDVTIDVTGPLARTKITQKFHNPSDGWVEGIYVFPLPDESAVDTLRMQIGTRFIEGLIKERQEARKIYEEAKRKGIKASLVEQERPNIFTNSVANIGPGETIIVQIEYQEHVRLDGGTFSLRFPMVVAPRYSPAPVVQMVSIGEQGWSTASDPVPDRERITAPVLRPSEDAQAPLHNPVSLQVNLSAGFDLGDVTSAHHQVVRHEQDDQTMLLTLKEGEVAANKDFELTWTAKAGQAPQAALFKETVNGEDYLLALVVPPKTQASEEVATRPREAIFVIDTSGSMGGESIRQARASLALALSQLGPQDRFNVIEFNSQSRALFARPMAANGVNISNAQGFVANLQATGGTEMLSALNLALPDWTPQDSTHVRQVVFLTDGAIGNEDQLFQAITNNLGRSRLFTVGIGSAPNSYFMSRAARLGRGTFTHIGDLSQVQARMAALFTKLQNPVMTDLIASWPANAAIEIWPNPLPDLYDGEPVVISAKMTKAKGTLRIAGNLGDEAWLAELPLHKAAPGKGVSKLWARKKIASLEESRFEGNSWEQVDKAVLNVALDHHLVSRLTSLVAIDITPSRPMGEALDSAKVPHNLPEGWDFDKVFGEALEKPVEIRKAALDGTQFAGLQIADSQAALNAPKSQQSIALPQGATPAWLMIIIGFMTICLGLSALFASKTSKIKT